MTAAALSAWERGRLDGRAGARGLLFGAMYEDPAIERAAFAPGGRIFTIASAGCTAIALARDHEVVAIDVNPRQVSYAAARASGVDPVRGTVDHLLALLRRGGALVGWRRERVRAFLDHDEPAAQLAFWRRHLDTRRFRVAFDLLLSLTALRAIYASPLLASLPRQFGKVMRARLERGFARHPNRSNPYARALLLGDPVVQAMPPAAAIQFEQGDAAEYLERVPAGSFDGFTISNILDGATAAYRARLGAAIARAARANAIVVERSFGEPHDANACERAAADRSLIWGSVDVRAPR